MHCVYGIPICTLIFRNYYATTVPEELVEAARVDGAGLLRTFGWIILPISIPGFVVTIIWQFTSAWNDYLFAIFLSNTRNGPITIALNALAGAQSPGLRRLDGRRADHVTADPGGVRPARPLVHRRSDGGLRQELTHQKARAPAHTMRRGL